MKRSLPYFLIALGAALWGAIGFFVKGLTSLGFNEMEIVTVRVLSASLLLAAIGGIRYRKQMKASLKDAHLFMGTGLLSIVFFNWCYFTAMNEINISIAVALLYTSPAFVTILSRLFLGEALYASKIFAVLATVAGCALIAGVHGGAGTGVQATGILIGLGAGLGYALYSIFGKLALAKYEPFTVVFYTFLVAAVFLVPISRIWEKSAILFELKALLYIFGLGLFPTVLAYFVYSAGLKKTESSKAAVIATFEPVVATLLGIMVYGETLGRYQLAGSLLIIGGVIPVNIQSQKKVHKNGERSAPV